MYVTGSSASVNANNAIQLTWNMDDVLGLRALTAANFDVVDLTPSYPTASQLLNVAAPDELRAAIKVAPVVGRLGDIVANSREGERDTSRPWLLAPCDLQAVKASGVTFVASLLERVIEERARGNPALADGARREIQAIIGPDLRGVRPGSPEAALWSPGWLTCRRRLEITFGCVSSLMSMMRPAPTSLAFPAPVVPAVYSSNSRM